MPVIHLGFTVSIRSAGREIPTYQQQAIDDRTTTCFIPSEAGQQFEVHFKNDVYTANGAVITTYVDGREMQGLTVSPYESATMQGVYETLETVRPFSFSRLKLKEDDGVASNVDISKLGLIEVHVSRAIVTHDDQHRSYNPRHVAAELDPVSEKAKKVGWHSISLGQRKIVPRARMPRVEYIDDKYRPYAIFRFRYQPREILEDQGIIPPEERLQRAASPASGSNLKRGREDDDEGEDGYDDDEDADGPRAGPSNKRHAPGRERVKQEPGTLRGATAAVKRERVPGEVIDLTERAPSPIRVGDAAGTVIDLTLD